VSFNFTTQCNNVSLNFTLLSLFDRYVRSIAKYGCEVWGAHSGPVIEKVHMNFCKSILCVKNVTTNAMVYYELDTLHFKYLKTLRILKYWLKL
jgi:hypothetical protein